MNSYLRATFAVDSIPGALFDGFSDGSTWNGWSCPYFERPEAERVLHLSEQNGFRWRYDVVEDAFFVSGQGPELNPEEVFASVEVDTTNGKTKLYPVGARAWIWEEVQA